MKSRGFVLLEVILAVAIFAIGVLALGRCANNCLVAERLRHKTALATQALQNRMLEIQGGAVLMKSAGAKSLTPPFSGMELQQSVSPLSLKNENSQDLTGLCAITLKVAWQSDGEPHEKSITFYALQKNP